ncbi:MAG TPA: HAMP domain-containing sensor histidine kinase [Chryseolinea sp.]|nr:HAMP domain-containing sensor histidine kinase [Chryseolinea sp.]
MFRNNFLYVVVILIGGLLLADIFLTNYNNNTLKESRQTRSEIAKVRMYYDQVGKVIIHSLDIGLRGYALIREERFATPMDNAYVWRDSIYQSLETALGNVHFSSPMYYALKDSVDSYTDFCFKLKGMLTRGDTATFRHLFKDDRGAGLWTAYLACETQIDTFLDETDTLAVSRMESAMMRNQLLQVLLFLICFPTLLYTVYYTMKTSSVLELLRQTEEEKNKILSEQNQVLERNVAERTQEILGQNEEILSQTEELATHRDALFLQNREVQRAHQFIEKQNLEIQSKNATLQQEIERQTQELRVANQELISHNNSLEQFAFIAAHNLRAPLARILGLANLIGISNEERDREDALDKIVASTHDLDGVVRDLSSILDIKKHNGKFSAVSPAQSLERILKTLESEIEESKANIEIDLHATSTLYGVAPYVESILYNLLSNALKYRNLEMAPIISVKGYLADDHVVITVADKGLGIDLVKYKDSVFNLYKRFHTHVEGKGLGLFLVRAQMLAMGGRVEIESATGKGTTFRLYFRNEAVQS